MFKLKRFEKLVIELYQYVPYKKLDQFKNQEHTEFLWQN